jgi:hypothetical protein
MQIREVQNAEETRVRLSKPQRNPRSSFAFVFQQPEIERRGFLENLGLKVVQSIKDVKESSHLFIFIC